MGVRAVLGFISTTHHQLGLRAIEFDPRSRPSHPAPPVGRHKLTFHSLCQALYLRKREDTIFSRPRRPLLENRLDVLALSAVLHGRVGEQRKELVGRGVKSHTITDEVGAEEMKIVLLLLRVGRGGKEGGLGRRNDEVGEPVVRESASAVQIRVEES